MAKTKPQKHPLTLASPAEQARGAGRNGNVPPAEYRYQPGQSGNPAGRPPNAGLTLKEWVNQFAAQELTERQIRKIARDPDASWTKRAAAERILRTIEQGSLADMEPWLDGAASLKDLEGKGLNVEVVKKAKVTRKVIGTTKGGEEVAIVSREI